MRLFKLLLLVVLGLPLSAQELPDAPSNYPHALFVLQSSVLTMAIIENGRATTMERYAGNGEELPHQSVGKYAAIHIPIALAATFAAWKLEHNQRKSLRVLGHVVMWSAVGYHSASYFTK